MIWILAGVLLAASAHYVASRSDSQSAINRWRVQVPRLLAGEDIYRTHEFPTPPIMALILYPFCVLPGKGAMIVWVAIKTVCTLAVVYWLARLCFPPGRPVGWELLAFAISFRPILADIQHGNVNLWILFCVTVGVVALSNGRPVWCGVWVGLATACKVTPGLLIVYLAYKRAYRAFFASLLFTVFWLWLAPALVLGGARTGELLQSWFQVMLAPPLVENRVETEQINQSLPGLVFRWTTPSVAIRPDGGAGAVQVNVVSWTSAQAKRLTFVISLLTVVVVGWAVGRGLPVTGRRWIHEWGLVLLATLLLSERSWKAHYVLVAPAVYALVGSLAWQGACRARWALAALLAFSALITLADSDFLGPLVGKSFCKYAEAAGVYVWAAIALALGQISLRERDPQPPTA